MTLIPLWTEENNRKVATYDHGTKVCLRCPLPNPACDESSGIPRCPLAYASYRMAEYIGRSQAWKVADSLAVLLDPDDTRSLKLYRQRVDDYTGLLAQAMAELKPTLNGKTKTAVQELAIEMVKSRAR